MAPRPHQETCMTDVHSSESVRRIRNLFRPIGWLRGDIRVNFRALRRQPGLVAAFALPIASAVAMTTALFSIVGGLFLRPLALTDPEPLVAMSPRRVDGVLPRVLCRIHPCNASGRTFARAWAHRR